MKKNNSVWSTVFRPTIKWITGLVIIFAVLDEAHHLAQSTAIGADLLLFACVWFFIELGISYADHKDLRGAYQSCDEKREELAQKYLTLSAEQEKKTKKQS